MSKTKKIIIGVVLGCVLLGCIGFGGFYFYKSNKILTTLTIDINPSIKLSLNYKDEIIKAEGLNDDGEKLLKEENFKGDDLEDAIEEIAELVVEKGYVTEEENHILINIDGKDIKEKVVTLITKEFKEENVECNVIVQEVNAEAKANAEKYGISESKASYIEEVLKENEDITFEELKDKSINEINKHIESKQQQKQEEENKKQEEEQKKEENKQNTTTNNSSSNSSSSGGGTGIVSVCSNATFNYENEDISKKVWGYLGVDSLFGTETVAYVYNNTCTYRTTLTYNNTHYVYYHNVTTGELIHKIEDRWVATDMDSQMSYSVNYFASSKGVPIEEVSQGNFCNDSLTNSNVTCAIIYNGQQYQVTIDRKTGNGISITP